MKKLQVMFRWKIFLYTAVVILAVASSAGCTDKKTTEVIGFPPSFADLAEKVKPAVVNISTTKTVTVPGNPFRHFFGPGEGGPSDDFFKHFFDETPDRQMKQQSLGSGFIINRDGFIVTNNHVVENADEIKVKLSDSREFKAKVIGRDAKTDLALIKISSSFENLPVLALGDSDKMRVGDWVMAVGNPFGLEQTVTQGIISATGRVIGSGPYDNFLQTDAPINPGNSGGPLVNLKGEVIGINTAIVQQGQGLGFAIPSSLAKTVIDQLKGKGKVVRGWIGISIQTMTPDLAKSFGMSEAKGALVGDVVRGGPADKGGIQQGDVIISFAGKNVKSANDLPLMVAETPVGHEVPVSLLRNGKEVHVTVKVAEMTEAKVAAQSQGAVASLGMKVDDLSPQWRQKFGIGEPGGVVVVSVDEGGLADQAGIQKGDIIKEVNRKPVKNLEEYSAAIEETPKGKPILFLLKRGKQSLFVTLEAS